MKGGLLRVALALVGGLPWISALGSHALPVSLKRAIDLAFAASCHHMPSRTLLLSAEPMCVCSRCAGIYAGLVLAALVSWSRDGTRRLRILLGTGFVLMTVDVVTQDLGLHAPWHAARLATGALTGSAAAAWMLASCKPGRADQRFAARLSLADRSASRKATCASPAYASTRV